MTHEEVLVALAYATLRCKHLEGVVADRDKEIQALRKATEPASRIAEEGNR